MKAVSQTRRTSLASYACDKVSKERCREGDCKPTINILARVYIVFTLESKSRVDFILSLALKN